MDDHGFNKMPINKIVEIPSELAFDMFAGKWDHQCDIKIRDLVVKCNSEKGDSNPNGTIGIVLGNIFQLMLGPGYIVFFKGASFPVFVHGDRVEKF